MIDKAKVFLKSIFVSWKLKKEILIFIITNKWNKSEEQTADSFFYNQLSFFLKEYNLPSLLEMKTGIFNPSLIAFIKILKRFWRFQWSNQVKDFWL